MSDWMLPLFFGATPKQLCPWNGAPSTWQRLDALVVGKPDGVPSCTSRG